MVKFENYGNIDDENNFGDFDKAIKIFYEDYQKRGNTKILIDLKDAITEKGAYKHILEYNNFLEENFKNHSDKDNILNGLKITPVALLNFIERQEAANTAIKKL